MVYCLSKHWGNFTFASYDILNCSKLCQDIFFMSDIFILVYFNISVGPVFCMFVH